MIRSAHRAVDIVRSCCWSQAPKRRLLSGLREVLNMAKLSRLRAVVMAYNIEPIRSDGTHSRASGLVVQEQPLDHESTQAGWTTRLRTSSSSPTRSEYRSCTHLGGASWAARSASRSACRSLGYWITLERRSTLSAWCSLPMKHASRRYERERANTTMTWVVLTDQAPGRLR